MKSTVLILTIILSILILMPLKSQPCNGGCAGQGGGPGGNGNGNDPCSGANPPPSCNNVPISGVEYLLIAGVTFGIIRVVKNTRSKKLSQTNFNS